MSNFETTFTMDTSAIHKNKSAASQTADTMNAISRMSTKQTLENSVEQNLGQQEQCQSRWSSSSGASSVVSADSVSAPTTAASTIGSVQSRKNQISDNNEFALPDNESDAPILWIIESGSKWSARYQHLKLKLQSILWGAKFHHPQVGLFLAGDSPQVLKHSHTVLGILLTPQDIQNWREVDGDVLRLCQTYWGDIGLPPVRYWLQRMKPGAVPTLRIDHTTKYMNGPGNHSSHLERTGTIKLKSKPTRFENTGLLTVPARESKGQ